MVEGHHYFYTVHLRGEDLWMAQGQKKHGPFAKSVLKGTPKARPSNGVREHAPLGKFLKSWIRL